jgi:hypothetical protein
MLLPSSHLAVLFAAGLHAVHIALRSLCLLSLVLSPPLYSSSLLSKRPTAHSSTS